MNKWLSGGPLLFLAFFQLAAPSRAAGGNANPYSQALQEYQASHYDRVCALLSSLLSEAPEVQAYRYLYANALVKTNQHKEAVVQYKVCYDLQPDSEYGRLSLSALKIYKESPNSLPNVPGLNGLATNQDKWAQQVSELKARKLSRPSGSRGLLEYTNKQLKEIHDEAQTAIRSLPMPQSYGVAGEQPNEVKRIRATAAEQSAIIMNASNKDVKKIQMLEQQQVQTTIDAVGDNLNSQVKSSQTPGAVKLDADHSNVYVRCYSSKQSK